MKNYEYKVDKKFTEHDFKRNSADEIHYLNKMGRDGWELVNVIGTNPSAILLDDTLYYWKRVKE